MKYFRKKSKFLTNPYYYGEKWRNPNYPNLPASEPILPPPIVLGNVLNTPGNLLNASGSF